MYVLWILICVHTENTISAHKREINTHTHTERLNIFYAQLLVCFLLLLLLHRSVWWCVCVHISIWLVFGVSCPRQTHTQHLAECENQYIKHVGHYMRARQKESGGLMKVAKIRAHMRQAHRYRTSYKHIHCYADPYLNGIVCNRFFFQMYIESYMRLVQGVSEPKVILLPIYATEQ